MSPSLVKMWVSFGGMAGMFLAILIIYLSRYKLQGILKVVTAIVAYLLMIISGIIMVFVVLSGPSS